MDVEVIINSLFENNGWYGFHDAVYEACGISRDEEKLRELFDELPIFIQDTAFNWGLNDTVFCDEVVRYIRGQA